MRRITGAILRVTVPATIIRSDCRGEARNTPAPKRSMSYREDTLAIISMAQQASPKVIGQSADFLDQFTTASRVVVITFASNCRSKTLIATSRAYSLWRIAYGSEETRSLWLSAIRYTPLALLRSVPFQRPLLPGVPEPDHEDADKQRHFQQPHQAQFAKRNGPWKQKDDLDVENDEQHRDDIVPHRKLDAGVREQGAPALIGGQLGPVGPIGPDYPPGQQGHQPESQGDDDEGHDRDVIERNRFVAHGSFVRGEALGVRRSQPTFFLHPLHLTPHASRLSL